MPELEGGRPAQPGDDDDRHRHDREPAEPAGRPVPGAGVRVGAAYLGPRVPGRIRRGQQAVEQADPQVWPGYRAGGQRARRPRERPGCGETARPRAGTSLGRQPGFGAVILPPLRFAELRTTPIAVIVGADPLTTARRAETHGVFPRFPFPALFSVSTGKLSVKVNSPGKTTPATTPVSHGNRRVPQVEVGVSDG